MPNVIQRIAFTTAFALAVSLSVVERRVVVLDTELAALGAREQVAGRLGMLPRYEDLHGAQSIE